MYATADQITDAIVRANVRIERSAAGLSTVIEPTREEMCGTYHIVGTWVGSERVYMAERIQEKEGFEVAYQSVLGGTDLNDIKEGDRFGFWYEDGIDYLDRTVLIKGLGARAGLALDVARMYAQEAIYDWFLGECISTKDLATAL